MKDKIITLHRLEDYVQTFNTTLSKRQIIRKVMSDMYDEFVVEQKQVVYPIGGFAPGNYYCTCTTCKGTFQGDKRAVQCEGCATKQQKQVVSDEEIEHKYPKDPLRGRYDLPNLLIMARRNGAKWMRNKLTNNK